MIFNYILLTLHRKPLPSWYAESKFGIFIVWGVYSVPGFESEWFWDYWKDPTNIRRNNNKTMYIKYAITSRYQFSRFGDLQYYLCAD
jgi:hypothetical protein